MNYIMIKNFFIAYALCFNSGAEAAPQFGLMPMVAGIAGDVVGQMIDSLVGGG